MMFDNSTSTDLFRGFGVEFANAETWFVLTNNTVEIPSLKIFQNIKTHEEGIDVKKRWIPSTYLIKTLTITHFKKLKSL